MRTVAVRAASLAAALIAAGPAGAQIRVAPIEVARFQLGPVRLTPTFAIRNIGIDNNVFNSRSGRRVDNTVILAPGLRLYAPLGRRLRLGGSGGLDIAWFAREADQRYVDVYGSAQGEVDVGPLTPFGGIEGGRYRSRFSIEIDDRVERTVSRANAGTGIRVGHRTLLILEGLAQEQRFDEGSASSPEDGASIKRALDRDRTGGRAELRYELTAKTTAVVEAERFEDVFVSDPSPLDTALSWRLLAGFDFSDAALVGGRVRLGVVTYPDDESQAAPPYDGLAARVSLSRELTWYSRLELELDRDVVYAVTQGRVAGSGRRNSFVFERYEGRLAFGLPRDALLRTGVGWEQADFLLPVRVGGEELERRDERLTLRGSLLWPVGPRLLVGGTVTWAQRRSNDPGAEYEGWNYGITAELRP